MFSDDVIRVLLLQDYNTRVVLLGVAMLGLASGVIGTFTLLRKRALVGDAASHAALPGVALAFMVMTAFGGDGRFLPGHLLGATLAGVAGMGSILAIRHATRLKEDAALGIVLSVYFGLGMALLGVIQKMRAGHAAGLESFIYGKTASMLAADAWIIGGMAVVVLLVCLLLFKELSLLCFDAEYAGSRGYPVRRLDSVLMLLIVITVVAGMQAVGLILMIALLIIPPAAARFWTHSLKKSIVIAALIGAVSGVIGGGISALAARMPAGAIIVVVAGVFFIVSLIFGPAHGVLYRVIHLFQLRSKTGEQHVLRLLHEYEETTGTQSVPRDTLRRAKSWSSQELRRVIRRAQRRGWIRTGTGPHVQLTEAGRKRARQVVRNHRLWEAYLIHYTQVAAHHVDRNADEIEHILGAPLVEKLEALVEGHTDEARLPPSPHALGEPSAAPDTSREGGR